MRAVIPVAGDDTIRALLSEPGLVRPDDWLTINSGGVDRPADPARVQRVGESFAEACPQARIYAFTSGLANVTALAQSIARPFEGIFYDYEPNYPNEPEFSFDVNTTSRNLAAATQPCHARGLRLIAYLTGRGLFNPGHQWQYGTFRPYADEVVIQTQSSLRNNRWPEAVGRILQDGPPLPQVQVTVCPGLPNTVEVPVAQAAWKDAASRGFPGCVVWWVPRGFNELKETLSVR